jgi:phospholipid/cholesterol/gamma-HCH transport system substrate-binding protein
MRRMLLAIAVVALVAAGCSLPGRTTGPIELTATFDDVGDLFVNHAVQVADVRVGSVKKIELTDDFRAKVTMSMKDIQLTQDVEAVVRTTSLLGEKFIELRPLEGVEDPTTCPCLEDGFELPDDRTREAPELETIAESAVEVLTAVAASDLRTIIETGAVGFGGRAVELRSLLDSLATISSTLADQSGNIVAIIDGLDRATSELAASAPDVDQLLVNLASATTTLDANRNQVLATLQQLTRLARAQNEEIFEPYFDKAVLQLQQLDAIVGVVAAGKDEVGTLVDWLDRFVQVIPIAIPDQFVLVYGWLIPCGVSSEC